MRSPEVETFYGVEDGYRTPYLTRVGLVRDRLSLHVFHRGDGDPDPHDHKRGFVTFPLTSYVEEVHDVATGGVRLKLVKAWRPHYRRATHVHRVLGPWGGGFYGRNIRIPLVACGQVVTLVLWIGRRRPTWGFWVEKPGGFVGRVFMGWTRYVAGERP